MLAVIDSPISYTSNYRGYDILVKISDVNVEEMLNTSMDFIVHKRELKSLRFEIDEGVHGTEVLFNYLNYENIPVDICSDHIQSLPDSSKAEEALIGHPMREQARLIEQANMSVLDRIKKFFTKKIF